MVTIVTRFYLRLHDPSRRVGGDVTAAGVDGPNSGG